MTKKVTEYVIYIYVYIIYIYINREGENRIVKKELINVDFKNLDRVLISRIGKCLKTKRCAYNYIILTTGSSRGTPLRNKII